MVHPESQTCNNLISRDTETSGSTMDQERVLTHDFETRKPNQSKRFTLKNATVFSKLSSFPKFQKWFLLDTMIHRFTSSRKGYLGMLPHPLEVTTQSIPCFCATGDPYNPSVCMNILCQSIVARPQESLFFFKIIYGFFA